MTLIVTATGLAGFLASFLMLHLGVNRMWVRYPLAVTLSYAVFLLLLKVWIVYQDRSMTQDLIDSTNFEPTDFFPSGGGSSSSVAHSGSSWSCGDLVPDLDADEWLALIILLIALIAGVVAAIFVVFSAPELFGEVFLDAFVVAALRKKMFRVAEQHWTVGALRRTAIPFLGVALVFCLAGAAIQHLHPAARSIGGIFHAERVERR
jgi:hypothetical protein